MLPNTGIMDYAQKSPDYLTSGHPTCCFIRRAMLEWINQGEEQQLTDDDIVDLENYACGNDLEDYNKGPQTAHRMNHSKGSNAIDTVPPNVQQQREATATGMMLA
jgi:hypothetical protein